MIRLPLNLSCIDITQRRGAALLVQTANHFESRIMIEYANTTVNAKSMLGLLSAASDSMKYQLTLVVDGEDEEAAVRAITGLVDSHFE